MSDKPYTKTGNTYYPKEQSIEVTDKEVKGNYWRAWLDTGKYYYEFDVGHFSSKFKTVEISEADFNLLKAGKVSHVDLQVKYSR